MDGAELASTECVLPGLGRLGEVTQAVAIAVAAAAPPQQRQRVEQRAAVAGVAGARLGGGDAGGRGLCDAGVGGALSAEATACIAAARFDPRALA